MTAPLFNLPIANPIAGGASQNAAQGPMAGFEALLAAFFGGMGETAAPLEAEPATGDKPAFGDDPAREAETMTPPQATMTLAALIATPQPVQATAPTTEAASEGDAESPTSPMPGAKQAEAFAPAQPGVKPSAVAPVPTAQADAPIDTPRGDTQPAADELATPVPAQTAEEDALEDRPVATLETATREKTPSTTPRPETAPRQSSPTPAASPEIQARPAPVQAPADEPQPAAPAELAAPAPPSVPHVAQPEHARAGAQPRTSRTEDGRQRHPANADRPADEFGAPQSAVKPTAEVRAAAGHASSPETDSALDAPRPEAKAQATDAPDFQAPAPAASAHAPPPPAPHAGQARATTETIANLTAEIGRKLEAKATRFEVELTPAGLGHVSVSVEIAASGKMTAAMSFDSPQAAAELRSRSHELQKALEQAGFDVTGGLSFDVNGDRGDGGRQLAQQQQQHQDGGAWRGRAFQAVLNVAGEAAETAASAALRYGRRTDAGVDIRI